MEAITYVKDFYAKEGFWKLRTRLYKMGIKVSYETNPDEPNKRIILTSIRNKRGEFSVPLIVQQCNGLILENTNISGETMKPLVIPPPLFRTKVDTPVVNEQLKKGMYDIIKLEDGTTVSLYWYNDKWCIGSNNGIDVSNIKWNIKTYSEILDDVLHNNNIMPTDFYSSLDKNSCYTFGFKHPAFHPFDTRYKIWFIQSINLTDFATTGVISHNYDTPPTTTPAISVQEKIDTPNNIKILYKILYNALDEYIQTKTVNYGFMLRAKDTAASTGVAVQLQQDLNIVLESSLLRLIRKMYYDKTLTTSAKSNGYDRHNYILVWSFLNKTSFGAVYDKFLLLFPQFQQEFNILDNIRSQLAADIKHRYDSSVIIETEPSAELKKTADIMYADLVKMITIAPKAKDLDQIISSFINDRVYVGQYYTLFNLAQLQLNQAATTAIETPQIIALPDISALTLTESVEHLKKQMLLTAPPGIDITPTTGVVENIIIHPIDQQTELAPTPMHATELLV